MKVLYVVEKNARLVKSGEKIEVRAEDALMQSARIDELSQVVIMSDAGLTTPLVRALMAQGVDVVFLSRQGTFIGRLSSGLSKNVLLRKHQYEFFQKAENCLELARRLVRGKIENQRRLLLRHQRRRPAEPVAVACTRLRHLAKEINNCSDLDSLRGLEGSAAREYFGVFGNVITQEDVKFAGRIRRPPPDPVNVLLSFGYTLLGNQVHSAVEACGLDAYLGCFHQLRYGRPSLVLDLMEEFRPLVDGIVLQAINNRIIGPKDFMQTRQEMDEAEQKFEREQYEQAQAEGRSSEPPSRPIIFLRAGVKKWLGLWNRRLEQRAFYAPRGMQLKFSEIIREQVLRFCEQLKGTSSYQPFELPW